MADERIALPRMLKSSVEQTMSNAELALLGHLIGDGCTLPTHAIQYTTRDIDLAEIVAGLARDVFGESLRVRVHRENGHDWYQVFLAASAHLTHGVQTPVRVWLEQLGVFGLRSYEKHVPEKVFEQPVEAIALFLRHLWATDGCIKLTRVGERFIPRIYYASSSLQLAQDVQALLLRLGINARVKRIDQKGKGRDQFHALLSGKPDIQAFIDRVAAVGSSKQASLETIRDYTADVVANTNRDIIPRDIWRMHAIPAMQAHGITGRQMQASLGNAYCGTALYKQNVSRARAASLAEAVASETIASLAQSDIYLDEIDSILPDGEEEVFDLTVPGHHNFVADQIVVQQQHRAGLGYCDVPVPRRGLQRGHGAPRRGRRDRRQAPQWPDGSVTLLFRKELTKFVNLRRQNVNLSDI
jgi:replicative DNA helicase